MTTYPPSSSELSAASKIFIEGSVFAGKKQSGIAYAVKNIILALCEAPELNKSEITLLITRDTVYLPTELQSIPNLRIKKLPFSSRVLRLMARVPGLFMLDIWLGRGTYIFPNFYNLPVPFSRSVTFVHDVSFLLYPETVHKKNLAFLAGNIRMWIRRSDIVATLTETSKQEIMKKLAIPAPKIIVVKVPLRREVFKPATKADISRVKRQYELPDAYAVYLGNIEPRKNLERFIRAFSQSKARAKQVSLLLVGTDGWGSAGVEEAISDAHKEGVLILSPKQFVRDEDLPAVLSGARFLAQPSIHEGFGIPPTQALACGTAVIVSDIPVMHEVVMDAATFFDPLNLADMTQAVNRTLKITEERLNDGEISGNVHKVLDCIEPATAIKPLVRNTL